MSSVFVYHDHALSLVFTSKRHMAGRQGQRGGAQRQASTHGRACIALAAKEEQPVGHARERVRIARLGVALDLQLRPGAPASATEPIAP